MTTIAYDVGDSRRLKATFKDTAGTIADPTTINFKIREPDGVETTYVFGTDSELVKEGTGIYYVDWTMAKPGRHIGRFIGTGNIIGTENYEFYARRKEVG